MNENQLVYLPIEELFPHPLNPRKDLGDLTELTDSIRAKGVLQNLTVQKGRMDADGNLYDGNGYTILIGHRRCAAAERAGLLTVPCIVVDISQAEQVQMMCMENMQRTDLTIYEQAVSFQMMLDFGGTVEEVAQKTGFSQSTIKRRLQMAKLDRETMMAVSSRQATMQDYDSLARIEDIETRNKVLCEIGTSNFNRALQKALTAQQDARDSEGWIAIFKSRGYTEIPYKECWDNKYRSVGSVSGAPDEKKLEEVDDTDTEEIFYAHAYSSTFYLRKLKNVNDEQAAADLEQEKRQAAIRRRDEKLKKIAERAFILRVEFIKNFPLGESKKVAGTVVKWHFLKEIVGMYSVGFFSGWAASQAGSAMYHTLFPFESKEDLAEFVDKHAEKALLMQVYAEWCDSAELKCWDWSGHYRRSEKLEMLYECLRSIGYQMSDEEIRMLKGDLPELEKDEDDVIDTAGDDADSGDSMNDADLDELLRAKLNELHEN